MAQDLKKPPFLEMCNIHKWFGKVHAVNGVDLTVDSGEVVAVIGDNGAGKSTLIKILVGLISKNKGDIFLEGNRVDIKSIHDSRKLGIEPLYQDQAIVDCMKVFQNIYLGREQYKKYGPFNFLDLQKMKDESEVLTRKLGLNISSPDQEIRFCSGGERQGVAIARTMCFKAKLIILDEPITALSLKGVKQVVNFITELKKNNIGVIIIEHNLGHAYSVADRFVIMSRGKIIKNVKKTETTLDELEEVTINL